MHSLLGAGDQGGKLFDSKAAAVGEILTTFRGAQLTGQTIGSYRLEELLGAGGMGVVYRGRNLLTGTPAAVKVIPAQIGDASWRARFELEGRELRAIQHQGVVRLLDTGEEDGYLFLAMELLEGETLGSRLAKHRFDWRKTAALGRQVASALSATHGVGLLHRDLKPENIILKTDGLAVLIDFGLAKKEENGDKLDSGMAGTIAYFSPEQVRGEPATGKTDIFALGAVLFEMLAGRRAFDGPTPFVIASSILKPKAHKIPGVVPARLARLVLRCLEKNPKRRPSAVELQTELEDIGKASSLQSLRTQRWLRGGLAAVAGVIFSASGWAYWLSLAPGPLFRQTIPTPGMNVFEPALAWNGSTMAFTSPGGNLLNVWVTPGNTWLPQQVTFDQAGASEPSLSPDGAQLAFRSLRNPEGIYVRDLKSGEERLLAPEGRSPKFSPDGNWIAYWEGQEDPADNLQDSKLRAFVIPARGGNPIPIAPEMAGSKHPVWAPDSRRVAFSSSVGLWAVPIHGGAPSLLKSADCRKPLAWVAQMGREEILFLEVPQKGGRVMAARLSGNFVVALTQQGDLSKHLTSDSMGRIVLGEESTSESLWSMNLNQKSAIPTPILRGGGNFEMPKISADARKLSYLFNSRLELRDLTSGRTQHFPAHTVLTKNGQPVQQVPGDLIWDISEEGDDFLTACESTRRMRAICRDRGGKRGILLEHPGLHLYLASFSADNAEVLFTGEADKSSPQMFIAQMANPNHDSWVRLGPGDYPRWLRPGEIVFLRRTSAGYPGLFRMALSSPPELLHEFAEPSPSPRLLRPGYFRIAAAPDRIVFPLGEKEGRLYRAEQFSSRTVSPFSNVSPVFGAGETILQKIQFISHSALLSALTFIGVSAPALGAVTYNVTAASSWGASDATLGVSGLSNFGFETTQLPNGVSIRFTRQDNNVQVYDTGFGGVLPFVFDSSQDTLGSPGSPFRSASAGDTNNLTAHAWDGTRSLVNVPTQPITSYSPSFGYGTIRINFQTPVSTVGFSLQQLNLAATINVMTNGGLVTTDTATQGLSVDGFRNGYLKINGTSGTTINYVEIVPGLTGFTDGIAIDHLAFSAQGTSTPEPGTALLVIAPLLGGLILNRRSKT